MNRDYAERRIRDALKITRGNHAKARRQIMNWALEDPRLLQGITAPHMTGIVAHAINRVEHKINNPDPEPIPEPLVEAVEGNDNAGFGLEILKAIAKDNASTFGLDTAPPPGKRGQASQRHIDAIQHMVKKSQGKSDQ